LASIVADHALVWDCAAGSGQASVDLAAHFDRVIATDASSSQIRAAAPHPRVEYRVAYAERSGLPDAGADLVTVAQALHWFELPAFYAEVRRVTKPAGALAVWTYSTTTVEGDDVHALVEAFYRDTVGPYWLPERMLVEAGYRTLPFPFAEVPAPSFALTVRWSMQQLLGYVSSWSATARFIDDNGRNPVLDLARRLEPLWGPPDRLRTVTWPLSVRAGRV
jgi:ubiquinone/menaquinone biosynthesis C-methylase UbiE